MKKVKIFCIHSLIWNLELDKFLQYLAPRKHCEFQCFIGMMITTKHCFHSICFGPKRVVCYMKKKNYIFHFQNLPWGDGKHTLFFNEEALPLPGKGYIREEELHVPILITLRNLFNMKARWNTKVGDEPSHGWKPIPGVDDHHH